MTWQSDANCSPLIARCWSSSNWPPSHCKWSVLIVLLLLQSWRMRPRPGWTRMHDVGRLILSRRLVSVLFFAPSTRSSEVNMLAFRFVRCDGGAQLAKTSLSPCVLYVGLSRISCQHIGSNAHVRKGEPARRASLPGTKCSRLTAIADFRPFFQGDDEEELTETPGQ
jgi:hypothetical protein